MPFMKVNLNGRKYVISGLTEQTSSKNILYSLARADSTFHLETTCTEFSDTSMENEERTKGTRIKRTRRTRVRRSSTSSLEIVKLDKDCLKGALTNKDILVHLESSEWSDGQGSGPQKALLEDVTKINDKTSHVICTECHATHPQKETKCDNCQPKETNENCTDGYIRSSECNESCKSHATCSDTKKPEVKRRKRKSRKRPVSQDVTGWKEIKDENNEKSNEKLGEKGWKSADDVRDDTKTLSSQNEKTKKREEKHKRKHKSKHGSHTKKIESKSLKNDHKTLTIIDNQSEYRRVKRHIRKELGDLRIQQMVSRTIDERFVDFHLACMKAGTNHHDNEREIRANLVQLIDSQQKCLSALKKAEKQNKKSMTRYSKYLRLNQEKIKFYGIANAGKTKPERTRKMSDTDTGISEMHSDSSAEQTYEPNYVINDVDFHQDVVRRRSSPSNFDGDADSKNNVILEDDVNSKNDVTLRESDSSANIVKESSLPNYVVTVDAIAIDEATHDVKTYVYEKDDDTRSEIIVAEPAGVVPPKTTSLVPYRSSESINTSTLSDNSESCFHDSDDVEELKRVLLLEQQRQREKRRALDRHYEEIKLMDKRIHEHEKMADILYRLKYLNTSLVDNENTENSDATAQDKTSLEKSIKLSRNLYDYQKSEINKNSSRLEQIESQVKRKRWHVESAVRELERAISSSSRSQLDSIRYFEKLPACLAGLTLSSDVTIESTLV